jgi:hypothetical protein
VIVDSVSKFNYQNSDGYAYAAIKKRLSFAFIGFLLLATICVELSIPLLVAQSKPGQPHQKHTMVN